MSRFVVIATLTAVLAISGSANLAFGGEVFGTTIGTFNNVPARSNGTPGYGSSLRNTETGVDTGIEWQCVEYVNRYYYLHYGINLRSRWSGNAPDFYPNSSTLGLSRFANGGTASPQVGDILCLSGGTLGGHVAIVREVTTTQVFVIQQNWNEDARDERFPFAMTVSGGTYTVAGASGMSIQGWLRNPIQASTVWAWGNNSWGQLGDGTTTPRTTPVQVSGLTGVTAAVALGLHTVALKSDGTAWAWGHNGYGQLGDGTTTDRTMPVQVSGLTSVVAMTAGGYQTMALKSDGTVWACGVNLNGQLGDGTTAERHTPVRVSGLTGVIAVAADFYHAVALKSDGTVWAWGANSYGQLGDGTTAERHTPVRVSGLTGVVALTAGRFHTVALKNDGTVWAWGANSYGQLGDGTMTSRTTPVQVSGLTGVVAVTAGGYHTVALKSDGTVWAWGYNGYGQLGDGTTTDRHISMQVSGPTGVAAVAAGANQTVALKSDGTVWAWGANSYGQLGDGTTTDRTMPVQVSGLTGVTAVAAAHYHTVALAGIGPQVRLSVQGFYSGSMCKSTFVPGETVTVKLQAQNSGAAANAIAMLAIFDSTYAYPPSDLSTVYDSLAAGQDQTMLIGANQSVTFSFTFTLPPGAKLGTYRLLAAVRQVPSDTGPVLDTTGPAPATVDWSAAAFVPAFGVWPAVPQDTAAHPQPPLPGICPVGAHLELFSAAAGQFMPVEGAVTVDATKPTVVMVHGWNIYDATTLNSSGEWIYRSVHNGAAVGKLGARGDLNILAWNWLEEAKTKVINDLVIDVPDDQVPSQGNLLATRLKNLFWSSGTPYGKEIHLIGHSLGAGVVTYAAKRLKSEGYNVTQVTLFDPPELNTSVQWVVGGLYLGIKPLHLGPLVKELFAQGVWIDNYVAAFGKVYEEAPIMNLDMASTFARLPADPRLIDDHGYPVAWYFGADGGLAGTVNAAGWPVTNLNVGASWSSVLCAVPSTSRPAAQDVKWLMQSSEQPYALRSQSLHPWPWSLWGTPQLLVAAVAVGDAQLMHLDGKDWVHVRTQAPEVVAGAVPFGAARLLTQNSTDGLDVTTPLPVYVFDDVTFAPQTVAISFKFTLAAPRSDDLLAVYFGDKLLWQMSGAAFPNGVSSFDSGLIDVSDFSGQSGTLTFVFNSSAAGQTAAFGDLQFQLAPLAFSALLDRDWVYQNTPLTTGGRHASVLTISVTSDPYGNSSYGATVTLNPSSIGKVVIVPTADPLVWNLCGGQPQVDPTGPVTLDITVTGGDNGGVGTTTAQVTVRQLGDIDGLGGVSGQDKLQLNKRLNGLVPDGREYDLDGLGGANGQDKLILNKILNGIAIP